MVHLSRPGEEQRKEESDVSHAALPERVSATGKKFTIFPSVLSPQVSAEGNSRQNFFSGSPGP